MSALAPQKGHLDFMVIGAAKSGTTTLFEHLRRHPDVWMPQAKEVPYFCGEDYATQSWAEHLREVFAGAPPNRLWGTATPQYMAGSLLAGSAIAREQPLERAIPARIRAHLPHVRLIAILRDPVERCVSAYQMSVRRGLERRPFAEVAEQLLKNDALESARLEPTDRNGHVVIGEYARILAGYYGTFEREQLLIVFTSDLRRDPLRTMKSVFSHISADPSFLPPNADAQYQPVNARAKNRWLDPDRLRARLGSTLPPVRALWRSLPVMTRERLDRHYGDLVYGSRLWNRTTSMSAPNSVPASARNALIAHYQSELALLTALLGCTPPWAAAYNQAIEAKDEMHA
jgi:hypothetical protein